MLCPATPRGAHSSFRPSAKRRSSVTPSSPRGPCPSPDLTFGGPCVQLDGCHGNSGGVNTLAILMFSVELRRRSASFSINSDMRALEYLHSKISHRIDSIASFHLHAPTGVPSKYISRLVQSWPSEDSHSTMNLKQLQDRSPNLSFQPKFG